MLGPEMIRILPGSFMMGGRSLSDEAPVHEVHFSKPFAIALYETTREEYDLFAIAMRTKDGPLLVPNDQRQGHDSRPVINVSWEDAKAYAKWLSEATGKRYRLPTESEWEYAARSGGKG
jgi:serine/threonine-protein kinase PpkA